MSHGVRTTRWNDAEDTSATPAGNPAGEIRLPAAPAAGQRARLLAGMTEYNEPSTIIQTTFSLSII
ncbi:MULTISPECIES: hypothetical protein [unclassified Streptomyces]|uniref:hypothetical protein n=1 Tax=unclassified Streptomyces TaxID=2593676 RepID=UPI00136CC5FE|nr:MULTISPECIES: hypothetical protein [unclassified Streptomyces]MCW5252483.1 hypothetical protein [Streptomyces sp. SHP 1-2]MYU21055.1 hypothetical protein [Streptomyces sp. SID8352]